MHLHSVTNYQLHKALYSGMNDHNFFEIAHTVRRFAGNGGRPVGCRLYNFVDNHDVERIYSKLVNKAHMIPVHILLYTLPGIPSVYYGSEFGIAGEKKRGGSDDAIRPKLDLRDFRDAFVENPYTALIASLGHLHAVEAPVFAYGSYEELALTTTMFAFRRSFGGRSVIVTVNNSDAEASFDLPAGEEKLLAGALFGSRVRAEDGRIHVKIGPNSGEVWIREDNGNAEEQKALREMAENLRRENEKKAAEEAARLAEMERKAADTLHLSETAGAFSGKPYEEMTVEELQAAILLKMRKNGPVTDEMRRTVMENTHHGSLINWVKSFR